MCAPNALKLRRAVIAFFLAYLAITILGTILSLAIAAILHTPLSAEPLANQAYVLSEPFLPVLNLLVWMAGSWFYFKDFPQKRPGLEHSVSLGFFWLVIALPLDFVAFVVIKTPLSLSPHDFYVGQFPWIYLIYAAVFVSPLCYTAMSRMLEGSPVRS